MIRRPALRALALAACVALAAPATASAAWSGTQTLFGRAPAVAGVTPLYGAGSELVFAWTQGNDLHAGVRPGGQTGGPGSSQVISTAGGSAAEHTP